MSGATYLAPKSALLCPRTKVPASMEEYPRDFFASFTKRQRGGSGADSRLSAGRDGSGDDALRFEFEEDGDEASTVTTGDAGGSSTTPSGDAMSFARALFTIGACVMSGAGVCRGCCSPLVVLGGRCSPLAVVGGCGGDRG